MTDVATRIVRREKGAKPWSAHAELCVVGAGISGVSAALEAARLGRKVLLVDGLPALGGQAVNSIIGTFCGLFSNQRSSGDEPVQLTHGIADGIRCDADGNIWAGARPGVQVVAPSGERIGMIRLPETCANVCFGGLRRNRLFMTASQSLYVVYVETTGAHIA